MENVFSTIDEISHYLKLKPSTIYAMVAEKRIPHFRLGRLVRFKKSEIDLSIEGHKEGRVSPSRGRAHPEADLNNKDPFGKGRR